MPLLYREVQDNVPDKDGNYLWRPVIVKMRPTITTRALGKFIAAENSLTEADVSAVLLSLTRVMNIHLMNSQSVRLDGLGTFTIRSKSRGRGVVNKKEVNTEQIKGLTCQFTPEYNRTSFDGTTRALYAGAHFMHVDKLLKVSNGPDEDEDDNEYNDPLSK